MYELKRRPTAPGEVLREEFLDPLRLTQAQLADKMGVPLQRVNTIITGRRAITAETALLLARVLKTSPEFWMNLQSAIDLWDARQKLKEAF